MYSSGKLSELIHNCTLPLPLQCGNSFELTSSALLPLYLTNSPSPNPTCNVLFQTPCSSSLAQRPNPILLCIHALLAIPRSKRFSKDVESTSRTSVSSSSKEKPSPSEYNDSLLEYLVDIVSIVELKAPIETALTGIVGGTGGQGMFLDS